MTKLIMLADLFKEEPMTTPDDLFEKCAEELTKFAQDTIQVVITGEEKYASWNKFHEFAAIQLSLAYNQGRIDLVEELRGKQNDKG